jgi:hypothetical protein
MIHFRPLKAEGLASEVYRIKKTLRAAFGCPGTVTGRRQARPTRGPWPAGSLDLTYGTYRPELFAVTARRLDIADALGES